MREELKKLEGDRDAFVGTLVKLGVKTSFKGASLQTILLKDLRRVSDGKLLCDHLWLNKTKAFAELDLTVGMKIQFVARVTSYSKGYQGKRDDVKRSVAQDFKLSHPTQVQEVGRKEKESKREKTAVIIRKRT